MKPILLASLFVPAVCTGCSLGQGEGDVKSDALFARDCWYDAYDLQPDFFAAVPYSPSYRDDLDVQVPYRDTVNIRVQRGTDMQEVSDGMTVLVQDVKRVRKDLLGQPLAVTLPAGVLPPGATLPPPPPDGSAPPEPTPAIHMALYLQRSCHNQNAVLYAVDGTITFHSLFSGDPNEDEASDKFTNAEFSVEMGDPRDAPVGALASEIPDDRRSLVTGFFRFYFERGQPGQPFP
ncbi:MAG: hypothetical protein IPM54_33725 [Polyangiaceae bacterium]|nr:hypothetical protein [Polyangiaceae bacterium]